MISTFQATSISAGALTLRPVQSQDIDPIAEACTDPLIQQWLPIPRPYQRSHAAEFVETMAPQLLLSNTGIPFAIDDGAGLVGVIDLKGTDWANRTSETGYWIAPRARGRGIATLAVRRLAEWALGDVGLERIVLQAAPGNLASRRVAEKAGFRHEGLARNAGTVHGGRTDLFVYSLIPADLTS